MALTEADLDSVFGAEDEAAPPAPPPPPAAYREPNFLEDPTGARADGVNTAAPDALEQDLDAIFGAEESAPAGPSWVDKQAGIASKRHLAEFDANQEDAVRMVFRNNATEPPPERMAEVVRLQRETGADSDTIKRNFDEFQAMASQAREDPRAWMEKNPHLAAIVLRSGPDVASLVTQDKPLSLFAQANNAILDAQQWLGAKWEPLGKAQRWLAQPSHQLAPPMGVKDEEGKDYLEAGRVLPEKETLVRDATSEAMQAMGWQGTVALPFIRFRESLQQMELSQLSYQLMRTRIGNAIDGKGAAAAPSAPLYSDGMLVPTAPPAGSPAPRDTFLGVRLRDDNAPVFGGDDLALESRILDLRSKAVRRDYGEGPGARVLGSVAEAMASQWVVTEKAGIAGGVGAIAGAAVGALATKTPAGAYEGALKGLSLFGQVGMAKASFELEAGGFYDSSGNERTDDGKAIPEEVRWGGAVMYGTLASIVEVASAGQLLKSMGPLGESVRKGEAKAYFQALMKDPTVRQIFRKVGAGLVKGAGSEGGEEGVQEGLSQLFSYLTKGAAQGSAPKGPIFNPEAILTSIQAGTVGGLGIAIPASAFSLATQLRERDKSVQAGQQVAAISNLLESPTTRAAPEAVAEMIRRTTAESGAPVTDLHVDARKFNELFQGENTDPMEAAAELMGVDGPAQLKEAMATGGRLRVPLELYLQKWGGKEVAKALGQHTSTSAILPTPAEEAAAVEVTRARVDELVAAFEAGNAPVASQKEQAYADALEKQLLTTGRAGSAEDVRKAVLVHRAFIRATSERFQLIPDEMFGQYAVQAQKMEDAAPAAPPAATAAPVASPAPLTLAKAVQAVSTLQQPAAPINQVAHLMQQVRELKPQQRVDESFRDTNSGLLNERAFNELPADPSKPLVAHISVEGVAYINDNASHDKGDRLYRAAARAIASARPLDAAKVGGDFAVRVADQAELNELLEKANAAMSLKGFELTGALGATFKEADKAHRAAKNQLEADKKRAPRKTKPLGMQGEIADLPFTEEQAAVPVPEGLASSVTGLTDEEYLERTYRDETGAWTANGWERLQRKANVAAFDLSGLSAANDKYGEKTGDRMIAHLKDMAMSIRGGDFDFAHLHGDEYAAQHADKAKLEAFVEDLHILAERSPLGVEEAKVAGGGLIHLHFWDGIGELTYEAADKNLNERKKARQAANPQGVPGSGKSAADDSQGVPGPGVSGQRPEVAGGGSGSPGPERAGGTEDSSQDSRRGEGDGGRGEAEGGEGGTGEAGQDSSGLRRELEQAALKPGEKEFFQPGDEGAPKAPRGRVRFNDAAKEGMQRIFNIALSKDADLSTFLHESGHVFLEIFADLAAREDAPPSVKEDYAKALKWMGVESFEEIQTEHHEKWASGFEAYLMEGKAPTPELAGAFQRFRLWLTRIYKSMKALDVDLNEDITGVFDRLLATDEEIERSKKQMGFELMTPEVARSIGLEGTDYAQYLKDAAAATSTATRQVELRALKDRLRATEEWWQEELADELERAEEAFKVLPVNRAYQYIRAGIFIADNGTSTKSNPIKLKRQAVAYALGRPGASNISQLQKKEGADPGDIAALFGFRDGRALLEELEQRPERGAWVKKQANAAMEEKHPDVINERTELRELAAKGLHGDHGAKWLVAEWRALGKKAKFDPETGRFFNADGFSFNPPPLEAIQMAAKEIARKREVRRLDPGVALRAERSASNKAAAAIAKGNFELAYALKQEQLLNMYLHRYLAEAREARDKFEKLAGELSKDKARARLGKARPQYLDAVDLILETLNLKAAPEKREKAIGSIGDAVTQMTADGGTVMFDEEVVGAALANPTDWKSLTVAQLEEVHNALLNIQATARGVLTSILDGKRVEKEDLIRELIADAENNLKDLGRFSSSTSAEGFGKKFIGGVASIDGSLLKPETLLSWLGGGDLNSVWFRAIMKPLQDAKAREADLLKATVKPIVEAFEKMPADTRGRANEDIDGDKLFPTHREDVAPPSKRFELLVMALNSGNESNLHRLLEGRNITMEQVTSAINTQLSKEEMDWVQSVWDAAESLWPEASALEQRNSGLAPPKIEHKPLVTAFGTYPGGYFPAVYDRRVEAVGEKQEASTIAGLMDPNFTRPGTARSHLKSRAQEFSGALKLEPGTIGSHLSQVVHDIAYREALQSAGGLIINGEIQAVLKRRLGDERAEQFLQWLKDVGQMRGMSAGVHTKAWEKIRKRLRSNTILSVLGYSATTALGDLSNIIAAVPGTELKTKHWAAGLLEFARSPMDTIAAVHEKSGEMRSRRDSLTRELAENVKQLTASGHPAARAVRGFKKHAFALLEATDLGTSTPIWLGCYRQGLANEMSEADAITFADVQIRKLFPSHSAVDQAAVLRDKGFLGASLMFYGYFNVTYNVYRNELHGFHTAEDWVEGVKRAPAIVGSMLAFGVATNIYAEALSGRGREDDEEWVDWFTRKLAVGMLTSVPLLGEGAQQIEHKVMGKHSNPRNSSLAGVLIGAGEAVIKIFDEGVDIEKRIIGLFVAFAPLTGLPMAQVNRIYRYGMDVGQGDIAPRNAADVVGGAVYGQREGQPWNFPRGVGNVVDSGDLSTFGD